MTDHSSHNIPGNFCREIFFVDHLQRRKLTATAYRSVALPRSRVHSSSSPMAASQSFLYNLTGENFPIYGSNLICLYSHTTDCMRAAIWSPLVPSRRPVTNQSCQITVCAWLTVPYGCYSKLLHSILCTCIHSSGRAWRRPCRYSHFWN